MFLSAGQPAVDLVSKRLENKDAPQVKLVFMDIFLKGDMNGFDAIDAIKVEYM